MTDWQTSKFRAWWEGDPSVPWWLRVLTGLGILVVCYLGLQVCLWLAWPMACGIDGGRC